MILAVGLTPAWQQIVTVDDLKVGAVNRASSVDWYGSGKVINVASALVALGEKVHCAAPIGGMTGTALMENIHQTGVVLHPIRVSCPTRVCSTIVDRSGVATEIVENAQALTEAELNNFLRVIEELSNDATVLTLSGSMPTGTRATFCREIIDLVTCPVVLDIRGPELRAALSSGPLIVKPNLEELELTVNRSLNPDSVYRAMDELRNEGAEWVVVSDGPNRVAVAGPSGWYEIQPPQMNSVVNPIGAGDCMTAGIAWSLQSNPRDVELALLAGVAAAVDSVLHMVPAELDRLRVDQIRTQLQVRPV